MAPENTVFSENNPFYNYFRPEIKGIENLLQLALDLQWSWNTDTDDIWQALDDELWEATRNPWLILKTVSKKYLEELLADDAFLKKIDALLQQQKQLNTEQTWFKQKYANSSLKTVAYFSMEFMLSEALPVYVGGLGNVAGDQLKAASDIGVPVIGISLLYQQGYFRQQIDEDGVQCAFFPYNDPGQLPVQPLRLETGEWLRFKIKIDKQEVWLRTWQVQVGRNKLYLLDSNDMANAPQYREITNELYGGGSEQRIRQEIVLGIGGMKLLEALHIQPEVCHMNEGHAAFIVLARAAQYMKQHKVSFHEALAITRVGNLFTTHTAVSAGFDYFTPALMWQYFGEYVKDEPGIDFEDLMALGRCNADNSSESFNMANLAIRGSGAVNGVSLLHGEVSKYLFERLFPRWPINEVPIGAVTNGVHVPSWHSPAANLFWSSACGDNCWKDNLAGLKENIASVSDEKLWQFRTENRHNFISYLRKKFESKSWSSGIPLRFINNVSEVFSPEILTIGFARRFVPYKRTNLLLHDEQRLLNLLNNADKPIQLVIAGKAPPFDETSKGLIQQWIQFIHRHNLYHRVIFLTDYDVLLSEQMVQGVDVWLNTPRRPWEACGTSGMKVLANGGLNLSVLDGWWAEAYTPDVGWAVGDALVHNDELAQDAHDAEQLYEVLETQVIPEFYDRDETGRPARWIQRIRNSMASLTPAFSADRAVREYTEKYYLPAADAFLNRTKDNGQRGKNIYNATQALRLLWNKIKFGNITVANVDNGYEFSVEVIVEEGKLENIAVEMYADGTNGNAPEKITMNEDSFDEAAKSYLYKAKIATQRSPEDYTARIIPRYENMSVPLEANFILWQR